MASEGRGVASSALEGAQELYQVLRKHWKSYRISSYSFRPWIVSAHLCTMTFGLMYCDLWISKFKNYMRKYVTCKVSTSYPNCFYEYLMWIYFVYTQHIRVDQKLFNPIVQPCLVTVASFRHLIQHWVKKKALICAKTY